MTPNNGKPLAKSAYSETSFVKVRNGTLLPIKHVGHSTVSTPVKQLHVSHVLHVTQLGHNLLFVKQLCLDNKCNVTFDFDSVRFN